MLSFDHKSVTPSFPHALWKSATGLPGGFSQRCGRGAVDGSGGADIALATCEKMKESEATVWAQHGLFVSSSDLDVTFGLMRTSSRNPPKSG